jgi:hypothetical protein
MPSCQESRRPTRPGLPDDFDRAGRPISQARSAAFAKHHQQITSPGVTQRLRRFALSGPGDFRAGKRGPEESPINRVEEESQHDRLHCLIEDHWSRSRFQARFVGQGTRFDRSGKWFRATVVASDEKRCEDAGNGAARGTRTPDPVITNDVLYQLSYCGKTLKPGR